MCGDFFRNQSNLAYHLATKTHYRERLLEEFGANGSTCPKCNKVLKSQKELFKHLASVHKVVFTYYKEEMQERGLEEKGQLERKRGQSYNSWFGAPGAPGAPRAPGAPGAPEEPQMVSCRWIDNVG